MNDELDVLAAIPRCNCGKCTCANNEKLEQFSKSLKLSQFLMGLGEQYTYVRGHLLMMNPTPRLSVVYRLLMQEENQRESGSGVLTSESLALSVKHHKNQAGSQYQSKFGKQNNNIRKFADASAICEVCQLTGHTKEKCFCVHGYPA